LARFSYIIVSDTHLCAQHGRRNALTLIKRGVRYNIDTILNQNRELGLLSLLKPASYVPPIISGVAQFCFARSAVTDAIVITGDVATSGVDADLNVARNFVTAQAAVGYVSDTRFPTLNASGLPVYVMPGNHDRYADNVGTPNCRNFDALLSAYMPNFVSDIGYWIDQKENVQVAFVYADFTLQARIDALDNFFGIYGQGRVYQDVLESLNDKTRQLQTENKVSCVVWVMHFAPFECGYGLRLINFNDVLSSATELGVKAILCGHTHDASRAVQSGHTVYCSGSAGCIDRENDARIHVLNIDIGTECLISRENHVWHAGQHEFLFESND
jgi:3',5'-cyclic AMP phosphodiesterase CpdA